MPFPPKLNFPPNQATATTYVLSLLAPLVAYSLYIRGKQLSRIVAQNRAIGRGQSDGAAKEPASHWWTTVQFHRLLLAQDPPAIPAWLGTSLSTLDLLLLVVLITLNAVFIFLPIPRPLDSSEVWALHYVALRFSWLAIGNVFFIVMSE